MLIKPTHISEALRIFRRSLKVRVSGFKKYDGDAKEICERIINDCFNGKYFQTSTGHFCQFWTRDFGMCAESLVKLGYKKEVGMTLEYALERFSTANKITTTITPKGKPFNFPRFAVDSIPFLIHAIKISGRIDLIKKYNYFLIKEVQFYFEKVFDPLTSMVRQNVHFSSIKDHYVRNSATYDNCMLVMLKNDLNELKL